MKNFKPEILKITLLSLCVLGLIALLNLSFQKTTTNGVVKVLAVLGIICTFYVVLMDLITELLTIKLNLNPTKEHLNFLNELKIMFKTKNCDIQGLTLKLGYNRSYFCFAIEPSIYIQKDLKNATKHTLQFLVMHEFAHYLQWKNRSIYRKDKVELEVEADTFALHNCESPSLKRYQEVMTEIGAVQLNKKNLKEKELGRLYFKRKEKLALIFN